MVHFKEYFKSPTGLTVLFFLCISTLCNNAIGQVIWEENFEGYTPATKQGGNLNFNNPEPDWTSTYIDCDDTGDATTFGTSYWGTRGNSFLVNDIEGVNCCDTNNSNFIESEVIDISAFPLIEFTVLARTEGSLECDSDCKENDKITVLIRVDGGDYRAVCGNPSNCGPVSNLDISESFLTGPTLQFKIIMNNNEDDEFLYLDEIRVSAVPEYTISYSTACSDTNLTFRLNGAENALLNWSNSGLISSAGDSAVYNFANPGQQNLSVTINKNGCLYTVDTLINVIEPQLNLVGPDLACANDTLFFNVSGPDSSQSNFEGWSASGGARIGDAIGAAKAYQFVTGGTKLISVTTITQGCAQTLEKSVEINQGPSLQLSANQTAICIGDPVILTANSFGTAEDISWSENLAFSPILGAPGDSSISVLPEASRWYYCKGEAMSCETIDSILVQVVNPDLPRNTLFCDPSQDLTLIVNAVNGSTYLWDTLPDFSSPTPPLNNSAIVVVSPPKSTTYYLRMSNGSCVIEDSVTVHIIDSLLPKNPEVICEAGVPFNAIITHHQSGRSFSWSDDPTHQTAFSTDSIFSLQVGQPKAIYLRIASDFCTLNHDFLLSPFIVPQPGDIFKCLDQNPVRLGPFDTFPGTIEWEVNGIIDSSNYDLPNPNVVVDSATTIFRATYSYQGCTETFEQMVFLDEIQDPLASYPDTFAICDPTEPQQIIANAGRVGSEYFWSEFPAYTPSFEFDSIVDYVLGEKPSQTLYLRVNTPSGCNIDTEIHLVNIEPLPSIEGPSVFCNGDTLGLKLDTSLFKVKPISIFWDPFPKITYRTAYGDSINLAPFNITEVTANVYFNSNCTRQITTTLVNSDISYYFPPIEVTSDSILYIGDTISVENLMPADTAIIRSVWIPPGLDLDSTAVLQEYIANRDLEFVILRHKDSLCSRNDTIFLDLNFTERFCGPIYVPNAFSPNRDGENEILHVRGRNISELNWRIYNRLGQEVFSTENPFEGWDGTHNGKAISNGSLIYTLMGACTNGENFKQQGTITILR